MNAARRIARRDDNPQPFRMTAPHVVTEKQRRKVGCENPGERRKCAATSPLFARSTPLPMPTIQHQTVPIAKKKLERRGIILFAHAGRCLSDVQILKMPPD
jgi:hypothetical protein